MIEFQYFEGCPNSTATLKNLRELVKKEVISVNELLVVEVPDVESAEKHHFQGSPTILVDGIDICTGNRPVGFYYTCRVYDVDGERTGTLLKISLKKGSKNWGTESLDNGHALLSREGKTHVITAFSIVTTHHETFLSFLNHPAIILIP